MTADRGRVFYEYFLTDGIAWSRRSLIPADADPRQLQRWWNQCFGIAYYARNAESITLKSDAVVDYRAAGRQPVKNRPASRPAYVLAVTAGDTKADLYIDRRTFYLLQEDLGSLRRLYGGFQGFEGVIHPTLILEVTKGRQGDSVRPFQIRSVKYNEPIEDWMFAEDMPGKK
jgi:hypothetical protein